MTSQFIHAYRQAPWRVQLQWILLFLLGLTLVAFVAGIYLSVSARSASTGRDIQRKESQAEDVQSQIADQETQLAYLSSAAMMQSRAKEMGFVPAEPGKELYLVIKGYTGRQPVVLAPPPTPKTAQEPLIKPNYTQSLWEWLFQAFLNTPSSTGQAQP